MQENQFIQGFFIKINYIYNILLNRYGDEQNLAPFMALLSALVFYVQDMNDELKYFKNIYFILNCLFF